MSDLFGLTDSRMARFVSLVPNSFGKSRFDDPRVLSEILVVKKGYLA